MVPEINPYDYPDPFPYDLTLKSNRLCKTQKRRKRPSDLPLLLQRCCTSLHWYCFRFGSHSVNRPEHDSPESWSTAFKYPQPQICGYFFHI